jgi:nucleotide-binding universal stress UspA family protein
MSEEVRQQIRDQYQKEATEKIVKLLSRALARAKVARSDAFAWTPYVAFGDPRDVIKNVVKQTDSDLLVLGTRGHTGAAYVFLGSMAGNVLRDVDCDTLVVPPRRNRSR